MSKWTEYKDALVQDVMLKTVLDNGIELFVLKKPGFIKKYGYFGTRYGSFNQCFEYEGEERCMPTGIAHFLEHKIFEADGTNLFDEFAALGAHVNAYTSYNATFYHFNCNENFTACMNLLLKFVQRINLTEENVEKEKGIIVQELKSYEDETEYMAYFKMVGQLYREHPLTQDVGGSQADVMAISKEQLEACYYSFYSPENMVIFVAGDVDEEEVYQTVMGQLTEEFLNRKKAVPRPIPNDSLRNNHDVTIFESEIQLPYFTMGFKGPNDFISRDNRHQESTAFRVLLDTHFGRGSAFYNDLYERSLINTSFGIDFTYGDGYSMLVFDGESSEPEVVANAIKEELKRCSAHQTDIKDFERVKKKMIGRLVSAGNSVQYMISTIISSYLKGLDTIDNSQAYLTSTPEIAYTVLQAIEDMNCSSLMIAKPFEKE